MDILKPIIRSFTYDFFSRRDGIDIRAHQNELRKSQFLSRDELTALQLNKLRAILLYCHDQNSFYRERFSQLQFHPAELAELSMITSMPILTKDEIREASVSLFSKGYGKENSIHKRTGGSTGVPLHVYWNKSAASFKRAGTRRHDAWASLIPGAKMACVWGDTSKRQSFKERVRNSLTERAFYLDTLTFDANHINEFLSKVITRRPDVMMGHAHSIFRLAEHVRTHNVPCPRFESVITTAMVLSSSERLTIESVFRSPVFDRYGCEEIGLIASECTSHNGMHIFAEGLIVECLSPKPGMPGKLVITDLVNYAMPLIRYEIGDYGIISDTVCSCGRSLPQLKEVSGRTADFLYRPDGTQVFGISILDTFVIHIAGLKQVQIIQDRYDHLDILVVRDMSFSDDTLAHLRKTVLDIFGPEMTYDIRYVDNIQLTESGKYRFSICNIEHEQSS